MKINREILRDEDRIDNFRELLDRSTKLYGDREAFLLKTNKDGKNAAAQYRKITHAEFRSEVDWLGTALTDLGLRDTHIAVIGENRYEWCLSYLSVACGCGVVVPVDKELHPDEVAMILNQSESAAILYSGKIFDKNLIEALVL